jgi:predicted 3-demethylubiquinone-9 3-methyltransferase (glyoxalase superfamily)
MQTIRTNLWFDTEAEDAARFYTSIFKDSKLGRVERYPAVGQEIHGKPAVSVLTVEFFLNGQPFIALNGGPEFKFNEAISLEVICEDEAEMNYYWDRLSDGGDPAAQQCGWLKDRFGVSWQVVPKVLLDMLADSDQQKRDRVFEAMLHMKKLDVPALRAAFEGQPAGSRR